MSDRRLFIAYARHVANFDIQTKFWDKVDFSHPDGCWIWTGYKMNGYGYLRFDGDYILAHRLSYMLAVGNIPDGLFIDHVSDRGCFNRACILPWHLEPVTNEENIHRAHFLAGKPKKTQCPSGHAYDEKNTGYNHKKNGKIERYCRACSARSSRARYKKMIS